MPFADSFFFGVVMRRVIHHFFQNLRLDLIDEVYRVMAPGGRIAVLEGTPGLYRRTTKWLARAAGLLEADTDMHGHLNASEIHDLFPHGRWNCLHRENLGSPIMIVARLKGEWTTSFLNLYKQSQFIKWWHFAVFEKRSRTHTSR